MKPFRPEDVKEKAKTRIPEIVISSVNKLLVQNKSTHSQTITIYQKDIIAEITSNSDWTSAELFKHKFLDFEELYSDYGWEVSYDKPGYNESYEASFKFKPKRSA